MLATLFGLLALAGCGSDGGGDGEIEAQGPAITPTLDTDRESSASVGPEGGVVTATGADGTEYSLSIPADALIAETEISLTPILSIDDLPMTGGFVAGVHFEPSGLELFRTATLTVELSSAPVLRSEELFTGFIYDGDGENLALSLADVDGSSFALPVRHFSGAGAGAATPSDLDAASPSDVADTFIAELVAAIEQGDDELIEPTMRAWYQARVRPALQAAVSSDAALERALAEYGRWLNHLLMLGLDPDDLLAESHDLAAAALREAIARANDLCERNESFEQAEKALLWQRRAESVLPEDELFAEALDRQSVLNELCLQVVIESTSFPQSPVAGEPALLEVVFGFAFGDGPTESSPGMVAFVLATGASPASATEFTDVEGRVQLTLTPDSGSVSIEVNACLGGGGFNLGQLLAGMVCQQAFIVRGLIINPNEAEVSPGDTVSFAALLGGTAANVNWSATGGTVDQNGLYTAGDEEGTFQVRATSVDDPSLTAAATVTVAGSSDGTLPEEFLGDWVGNLTETKFALGGEVVSNCGDLFESVPEDCVTFTFRDCANQPCSFTVLPGVTVSGNISSTLPFSFPFVYDGAGAGTQVVAERVTEPGCMISFSYSEDPSGTPKITGEMPNGSLQFGCDTASSNGFPTYATQFVLRRP